MDEVVMSYRTGLPPVLKGISMKVRDGEKIGVVGRTGAGKTVRGCLDTHICVCIWVELVLMLCCVVVDHGSVPFARTLLWDY